jgi:NAD(P)-dependent dehydrogenase (short-subunit alcohol dehydrogenase family)
VITDRSDNVEQLAAELAPRAHIAAVRADLTNVDDVARVVAAAAERFGRLDALINALAPGADPRDRQPADPLQGDAETLLQTCRAALPLLRESRGAIVNIVSPGAIRSAANPGEHSDSRAAIVALTRTLALDEKLNGVRVNAIAPRMIDTAGNRDGVGTATRSVSGDDVAAIALFLASRAAAGINGETVHVRAETLE